jgi:hypothetical protein
MPVAQRICGPPTRAGLFTQHAGQAAPGAIKTGNGSVADAQRSRVAPGRSTRRASPPMPAMTTNRELSFPTESERLAGPDLTLPDRTPSTRGCSDATDARLVRGEVAVSAWSDRNVGCSSKGGTLGSTIEALALSQGRALAWRFSPASAATLPMPTRAARGSSRASRRPAPSSRGSERRPLAFAARTGGR